MTAEREHRLRKTQRHMLRIILQRGRRRYPKDTSSTAEKTSTTSGSTDSSQSVEPWHEWVVRVTREVEELQRECGIENWVTQQKRRMWRWAGHVARRTDNRWSQVILRWKPEETHRNASRRCGRPSKRWEDVLRSFWSDADWMTAAEDRETWRLAEQLFCVLP